MQRRSALSQLGSAGIGRHRPPSSDAIGTMPRTAFVRKQALARERLLAVSA